jgi:hypothetical protein
MTDFIKPHFPVRGARMLLLCAAALLACGASFAEKPEWAGGKDKHAQHGKHDTDHGGGKKNKKHAPDQELQVGAYFGEPQRVAAREYYAKQFKAGHCPPGLAKKNNGCLPPGQAKKYTIGQPLPGGVVYYPVPAPVMVQLGRPPAGYKYVRVATDILLIAIGTSMVVDAIQDLNGL